MFSRASLAGLLGVLLLAASLAGCSMTKETVRLMYTPAAPQVLPAPTSPRVAVVLFEDKRGKEAIGQRRNGTAFQPSSSVPEWVSRSLADELTRTGLQVSYAPSIGLAQSARPDFIVTGEVEEVWLAETGLTTCSASVRLRVSMANRSGRVFEQTLTASQEKTGVPTASLVESALNDALREALGVAAAKINEAAR